MRIKADDTIAAVATPLGVGGVGIVRLSGPESLAMAGAMFRPSGSRGLAEAPTHTLLHGWIEKDQNPLDEVLAVAMRAPRSYTREDVVEIHCHGGLLAVRTVLKLALEQGARLADPGEFTMRAFLNGRLDLTRAEAVGDLVKARSLAALRISANQLRGRLYEEISLLKERVARATALLEAGLDFPEEDVVFHHGRQMQDDLEGVRGRLGDLLERARQGRLVREGLPVAIVGRPNVGKSSLLNALLRESRAIVTGVPGTTRDTLEETAEIRGLPLRLIDTAGIRDTADEVELEGISRTRRAIAQAELVLLVCDG
ncbi:MAG: tRNA uridine-5-carboxymethylaminomethyl(34) synthesis GTPase MnmE, partial [Deltaproteobacteria bacterium]|nr:tRNA uridine-5-carboxymethylaminomethyl(34) synthesis GTPase MnmE [Deltaproteobacteria bacterium]